MLFILHGYQVFVTMFCKGFKKTCKIMFLEKKWKKFKKGKIGKKGKKKEIDC